MVARIAKLTLILLTLTSLLASSMQETLVRGAGIKKSIQPALPRKSAQANAQWFDETWSYRVPIEITNPCGEALTDYQVQLILDSAFDFGHAEIDGADVRLTTVDGTTLIPFWIEAWDAVGETASIWVKIPGIPSGGTTLYLYYGNINPPAIPTIEVPPTGPWEKSAGNPIVPLGDPDLGANLLAENIVYDDVTGHYWMAFTLDRADPGVGLAWSDDPADPTAWNWHGNVITDAISAHIVESSGTWLIFYGDRGHGGPPLKISVASSPIISDTYNYVDTVLDVTEPWETDGISEPYVFQRNDGQWVLLYKGDAGSTTERVGYATAGDILGPYAKYSGNPAIDFGPSGYYDAGLVAGPWAVELNGVSYIGYTASDSISSTLQSAYVTTTDWLTFTRRGIVLPVAPPGEWDSTNAYRGAITRFGDIYYYAYTGGTNQVGIATQPALKAINDPDLVFEFQDPFAGNALTTRWQVNQQASGGTIVVGSDVITLTGQSSGISGYIQMWGNPLIATNTVLETYARHPDAGGPSVNDSAAEVGYKTTDFNNLIRIMDFPDLQNYSIQAVANGSDSGIITTTIRFDANWHTYRVYRTAPLTGTVDFQVDSSALETLGPPNVPTAGLRPWLMSFARDPVTSSRFVVDWVRVRKWCGSELLPTIGAEEIVLDLQINKSDFPDPVYVNQTLTYSIVMTNTGIVTATSVILTDTLPTEVTLASTTPSQGTCSGTSIISCDLGDLYHGTPVTVTIVVTPTVEGLLVNLAEVQTLLAEPVLANNIVTETTTVEPYADLSISMIDEPDPVFAGNPLTYTITVNNLGPSTASGVTLTDTLPANTNLISATPSQGSCSGISPVICDLTDIPSAVSVIVDILLTPTAGGLITNQAEIATDVYDPDGSNNAASESTTVDTAADLSISMADDPDPVFVGDPLTYVMTVTNTGPSTAVSMTLTNTLPLNTDLISATPSQGSCSGTSPLICDLASLSGGASVFIDIQVIPLNDGLITNQAEVTSSIDDPDGSNNNASESTTVVPSADLSVSMVDEPDPVYAGDLLTYTITVTNAGPSTGVSVTLTDTLPGNTNLISANPSQGSCSGISPVICDLSSIPISSSVTVDLLLIPTAEGLITNQVEVSSSIFDPDETNNTVFESTSVDPSADLTISKVDSPDPIFVDNDLTYTITVQNTGPSTAVAVVVTDTLPTEVSYVSAIPSQGSCVGTDLIVCSLNDLIEEEQASVVIVVTTNEVSTVLNEAVVSSSTFDLNPENNAVIEDTTVADAIVDLQISGTDTPDPVIAGETLTYRFDILNQGPSDATSVIFSDTLSTDTSYLAAETSQGTCTGLVCDLGSIEIGNSAAVTVVVSVDSSALDVMTNTALVTSLEPDQNSGDNTLNVETSVNTLADLGITKIDEPDPVVAGELLTYTLSVQNDGPSDALSITVADTLPAAVTFVSSDPSSPVCEANGGAVTCDLDSLTAGNSTQITLVVLVDPSFAGPSLTNLVEVTAGTSDPVSLNNTDQEVTAVDTLADLEILITDDPDPVGAGEMLMYTINLVNHGSSDSVDVNLVNDLPVGVVFAEVSPGSPECTNLSGVVICDFSSIPANDSIEVTILVTVGLNTVGTITDQAEVSAETSDPVLGNNTAEEDTLVMPPDTVAPVVSWLAPVGNDERYDVRGEMVQLEVNATDNVGVERVYFYRWDAVNLVEVPIGSVDSPPYQWDFDTSVLNPNWNQVNAVAYDTSGNTSERLIWLYLYKIIYLPVLMR